MYTSDFDKFWGDKVRSPNHVGELAESTIKDLTKGSLPETVKQTARQLLHEIEVMPLTSSVENFMHRHKELFARNVTIETENWLSESTGLSSYESCKALFELLKGRKDGQNHLLYADSFGLFVSSHGDEGKLRLYATIDGFNGVSISPEEMQGIISGDPQATGLFAVSLPDGSSYDTLAEMKFEAFTSLANNGARWIDRYSEIYSKPPCDYPTYTLLTGDITRPVIDRKVPVACVDNPGIPSLSYRNVDSLGHVYIRPTIPVELF